AGSGVARFGAVRVGERADPGGPVRVVLVRGHLRRDAVFRPLEVDLPVPALVPAALVPPRDAAVRVPPAALLERPGQALLRFGLRDLLEGGDRHEAAARRRWLVTTDGHQAWAPSKISIDSPALICTIAFFQP